MNVPVRKPHRGRKIHSGTKAKEVGADGREFFSRSQAARELALGESTLRLWHERGIFVPAVRRRGVWLYTREQLESKRRELPGSLASLAFQAFEKGNSPVQAVIALHADPGVIAQLHQSYVQMSGGWVVAGPIGSRATWEATYRIGTITPDKLRRALELVASDDRLRAKLLDQPIEEPG